jgi:hypothetical protein
MKDQPAAAMAAAMGPTMTATVVQQEEAVMMPPASVTATTPSRPHPRTLFAASDVWQWWN